MTRKRCLGCGTMRENIDGEYCSTCSDYEAVIAELEAQVAEYKNKAFNLSLIAECFADHIKRTSGEFPPMWETWKEQWATHMTKSNATTPEELYDEAMEQLKDNYKAKEAE